MLFYFVSKVQLRKFILQWVLEYIFNLLTQNFQRTVWIWCGIFHSNDGSSGTENRYTQIVKSFLLTIARPGLIPIIEMMRKPWRVVCWVQHNSRSHTVEDLLGVCNLNLDLRVEFYEYLFLSSEISLNDFLFFRIIHVLFLGIIDLRPKISKLNHIMKSHKNLIVKTIES